MALEKQIELKSGVIVNYHRIVSINKITNRTIIVEVASYTSQKKRDEEIEYYNDTNELKEPMNVFIETNFIEIQYNENIAIQEIYDYLKTLELFKDAKDI